MSRLGAVGRLRLGAGQRVQLAQHLVAEARGRRRAGPRRRDQVGEHVVGADQERRLGVVQLQLVGAHRSSTFSNTCAKVTSSTKPKAPAPPLIEWIARNTALRISSSASPSLSARQMALEIAQQLVALLEERALEFVELVHRAVLAPAFVRRS